MVTIGNGDGKVRGILNEPQRIPYTQLGRKQRRLEVVQREGHRTKNWCWERHT
jgi:hypothetical protein